MKLSTASKVFLVAVPLLVYPSLFYWYRWYAGSEMERTRNPELGWVFLLDLPVILILSFVIPVVGAAIIGFATNKQQLGSFMKPVGLVIAHMWFHITYTLSFVFLTLRAY